MTAALSDPRVAAQRVADVVTAGNGPYRARIEAAVASLKDSGLLAATVPARLGGPELHPSQIVEVVRILASADGSLAQIPQSHLTFSRWLFTGEHPEAEREWADRLLSGALIANAQAERDPVLIHRHRITGTKIFCTGSPFADILAVTGRRPGESRQSLAAFLPASSPGIHVVDDWDALGQRFTGSGTVLCEDAEIPDHRVYSFSRALELPGYGTFAQLLHAAIDVGIAGAAVEAALDISAATDPDSLTAHLAGELVAQRFVGEAVLGTAARALDNLWSHPDPPQEHRVRVALEVAAAKVTTGAVTVDLASRVYELTGTRGTAVGGPGALPGAGNDEGLDRHWRDLRTHTLHERRREKLAVLGRAAITGEQPELGPQL